MFDMEGMGKKQTCLPNSTAASTLGLHKNSQTISKVKPKIRIIHVFAPEIIKTDAENFRELVQRLTGKPSENCSTKKRARIARKVAARPITNKPAAPAKKMEQRNGLHSLELRERIKEEEEIWRGANSGGGFLGSFSDQFDGFMAELNEFPFLPLDASRMETYGEPQLA